MTAQVRRELWDLAGVMFAPGWVRIPANPAEMRSPPLPVTTPALVARRI